MSTHSPAPGTPQTPTKAAVATGLAFVATFVAFWIGDVDPFTAKDAGEGLLTAAIASGLIGGGSFVTRNRAR